MRHEKMKILRYHELVEKVLDAIKSLVRRKQRKNKNKNKKKKKEEENQIICKNKSEHSNL